MSGLRVPGPRVPGLKVPGLGSQVLILDYARFLLCCFCECVFIKGLHKSVVVEIKTRLVEA